MGFYQLYEKLGSVSPDRPSRRHRKRAPSSRAELCVSGEVAGQLQAKFAELSANKYRFIECIVALTNLRVAAQRLYYKVGSPLYDAHNNSNSRNSISNLRIQSQHWTREIQRQILALDRYLTEAIPSGRGRRRTGVYEIKRAKYLSDLQAFTNEILGILGQHKRDLKELCNEYCESISQQYYSSEYFEQYLMTLLTNVLVNPTTTTAETKRFLERVDHPVVLPHDTEEENREVNMYYEKVVAEILFRRHDMHMILDTLRLIDVVSPSLKVIEHRFLLNSFSTGYRNTNVEEEDESDSDSSIGSAGSGSGSDGQESLRPFALAKTVARLFSSTYENASGNDDYELGQMNSSDSGNASDDEEDNGIEDSEDDSSRLLVESSRSNVVPGFIMRAQQSRRCEGVVFGTLVILTVSLSVILLRV